MSHTPIVSVRQNDQHARRDHGMGDLTVHFDGPPDKAALPARSRKPRHIDPHDVIPPVFSCIHTVGIGTANPSIGKDPGQAPIRTLPTPQSTPHETPPDRPHPQTTLGVPLPSSPPCLQQRPSRLPTRINRLALLRHPNGWPDRFREPAPVINAASRMMRRWGKEKGPTCVGPFQHLWGTSTVPHSDHSQSVPKAPRKIKRSEVVVCPSPLRSVGQVVRDLEFAGTIVVRCGLVVVLRIRVGTAHHVVREVTEVVVDDVHAVRIDVVRSERQATALRARRTDDRSGTFPPPRRCC